jgi:hypothetical protein
LTLVIVLAIRVSALWLVALPAVTMLAWTGISRRREGGDLLADSLLIGKVEAPTLEKLKLATEEIVQEIQGPGPRD